MRLLSVSPYLEGRPLESVHSIDVGSLAEKPFRQLEAAFTCCKVPAWLLELKHIQPCMSVTSYAQFNTPEG